MISVKKKIDSIWSSSYQNFSSFIIIIYYEFFIRLLMWLFITWYIQKLVYLPQCYFFNQKFPSKSLPLQHKERNTFGLGPILNSAHVSPSPRKYQSAEKKKNKIMFQKLVHLIRVAFHFPKRKFKTKWILSNRRKRTRASREQRNRKED